MSVECARFTFCRAVRFPRPALLLRARRRRLRGGRRRPLLVRRAHRQHARRLGAPPLKVDGDGPRRADDHIEHGRVVEPAHLQPEVPEAATVGVQARALLSNLGGSQRGSCARSSRARQAARAQRAARGKRVGLWSGAWPHGHLAAGQGGSGRVSGHAARTLVPLTRATVSPTAIFPPGSLRATESATLAGLTAAPQPPIGP